MDGKQWRNTKSGIKSAKETGKMCIRDSYNGGFVFPGAVDKGMLAEIKPNGTDKVRAYSIDLKAVSYTHLRIS